MKEHSYIAGWLYECHHHGADKLPSLMSIFYGRPIYKRIVETIK